MWAALAGVAAALFGCSSDEDPSSAVDAGVRAVDSDAARSAADAAMEGEGGMPDCPAPSGSPDQRADTLVLELPEHPPPGLPFVLAVRTASGAPLTAAVQICAASEPIAVLNLYRGRGSATLTLPEGDVLLQAVASHARAERTVRVETRPVRELAQELSDADFRWVPEEDLLFTRDAHLPAANTMIVPAGARILFGANASLEVEGHLDVRGTAERPVLFTRAGDAAWGGIRLLPGSSASIEHAWIVAGGGDAARRWGHSRSQPVVWIEHAELVMRGGGTVDNLGKAFGADGARVELDGVLVSRCDTGGEFAKSELHVRNGHVLEMPDADGQLNDDDNDGIYISGAAEDVMGQPIESSIEDSVFLLGEDDGIDHNNGQLRVDRVWIERYTHEGIATSHGNRVSISNSVIRANSQGVEAGYGSPTVTIDHTLLTDNEVGLRFGDDYDKAVTGRIDVRDSIITGNHSLDVRNYVNQLGGPAADAIQITCSIVSDPGFVGTEGNVDVAPEGLWRDSGCAVGPRLDAMRCEGSVPGPTQCN
jgi:hypothetical protein